MTHEDNDGLDFRVRKLETIIEGMFSIIGTWEANIRELYQRIEALEAGKPWQDITLGEILRVST